MIQSRTADALSGAITSQTAAFDIQHPAADRLPAHEAIVARVRISVVEEREGGIPTDDIVVDVEPGGRWAGTNIW